MAQHLSRPARTLLLAVPLVGVLAACGSASAPGTASTRPAGVPSSAASGSPSAPDSTRLVLRLAYEGGFVSPQTTMTRVPEVSVYADGTVLAPGAIAEIYPGPLLLPVLTSRIPVGVVSALVEAGRTALSAMPSDLGQPPVADAPTTVVTVRDGESLRSVRAEALGIGDAVGAGQSGAGQSGAGQPGAGQPGVSPEQAAARVALTAFVTKVTAASRGSSGEEPAATPASPDTPVSPDSPAAPASPASPVSAAEYRPAAWLVWSSVYVADDSGLTPPPAVPWPGSTPLRTGEQWACQAVTGGDAEAVAAAARTARSTTPFASGGATFALAVRPVLPDETPSCPA